MTLKFLVELYGLSNYKKKEEDEEKETSKKGRHKEFVVLSKEVNVIMELDASFPMMNKELQALVGVLRIKIQDGVMTGLRVQQRAKNLALQISFQSLLLEALDQVIKIQEVQEQRQ